MAERLQTLLEKLMANFGDTLYIRHTPVMLQEGIGPPSDDIELVSD